MTTFLVALLVAVQQQSAPVQMPSDSVYATPYLAALIARAAQTNEPVPNHLASYRARVETEVSLVLLSMDGRESVAQVEQVASTVYWRTDGGLLQQVIGYRSQSTFPILVSALGFSKLTAPPITPTLYGNRLDSYGAAAPRAWTNTSLDQADAVHPFSARREQFYHFSGGDTVQVMHLATHDVPVVHIRVEPIANRPVRAKLFTGDIYLDATRLQVVRMHGRIVLADAHAAHEDDGPGGNLLVDFASSEFDGEYWLPSEQRWELRVTALRLSDRRAVLRLVNRIAARFSESRAVVRVTNRFTDLHANDSTALSLATQSDRFPFGRIAGLEDQHHLSSFVDWRAPMGGMRSRNDGRDVDQYTSQRATATAAPRLALDSRYVSQVARYNLLEGVFTGAGVKYDFGSVAPGLALRAHGGWAWREQTARGGVALVERTANWEFAARGERQITATNNLRGSFGNDPDEPPLFGDARYFDRRFAGLLARTTATHGIGWRFEVARAGDRVAGRGVIPFGPLAPGEVPAAIVAGDSTLSRAVFEGRYWLTRAALRLNPSAGASSLNRGWSVRVAYERASGTLEWRRYELGTSLRRRVGRWTLSVTGDAGIVRSDAPPPQALYQLRNITRFSNTIDVFPYTGDRASIARAAVMYTLPIFNAPVRVLHLRLPGPAPSPFVGMQSGWTDASVPALALMNRFGWRTSNGPRSAAEIGIRFFGGTLGISAIRPMEPGSHWRLGLGGNGGR